MNKAIMLATSVILAGWNGEWTLWLPILLVINAVSAYSTFKEIANER